jgi:hypothetical protein
MVVEGLREDLGELGMQGQGVLFLEDQSLVASPCDPVVWYKKDSFAVYRVHKSKTSERNSGSRGFFTA